MSLMFKIVGTLILFFNLSCSSSDKHSNRMPAALFGEDLLSLNDLYPPFELVINIHHQKIMPT